MRTHLPKNALLVPETATCVFKGIIFDVYQWEQEVFDGTTKTFEMLKRPDTVIVVAVKDDKIVVIEESQPNRAKCFDVPGGRHDQASETELEAIQRELSEETGLKFKSWRLLDVVQPHTKIEQFLYTFLATDFDTEVEPQPDSGEIISVHLMPFEEAKAVLTDENNPYPPTVIENVDTLEELLNLPEYQTDTPE